MVMNNTRQDFGTAMVTLARLYRQAEQSGDKRRAKVYAAAVELLLDAWPSDVEPAMPAVLTSERRLRAGAPSLDETLVGIGASDESHADPSSPKRFWHRGEGTSRRRG
jgi:hypothetical protein